MKKTLFTVILTAAAIGTFAWAQNVMKADQGRPGNQGPWPVSFAGGVNLIIDGGTISASPVPCSSILNTVVSVGAASTQVPSAALTGRTSVNICNSAQNGSGTQVKCRGDSNAAVFAPGNPGDFLEVGDCVLYNITSAFTPECISNAVNADVSAYQCVTP